MFHVGLLETNSRFPLVLWISATSAQDKPARFGAELRIIRAGAIVFVCCDTSLRIFSSCGFGLWVSMMTILVTFWRGPSSMSWDRGSVRELLFQKTLRASCPRYVSWCYDQVGGLP